MSTALYRRYRPETFADVIGQEHVTEPLMAAIDKDRINHAYLFSGPRGCGKTTSARILARCLNCAQGPTSTPCGTCDSCVGLARNGSGSLDVIEIDAASHGGVDDARDLRERATFAPVRDRFKIFIIDEAHMVTSAGFNALLKIVEEPPEHILFIFATTEPDKVIGTIRSRTHHYPFRLVPPEPLMAYLEQLCRQENVPVAPGVLSLVIRAGGGSVRDSLSVLDQLMAGAGENGLDYELAVSLLGYTHATLLDDVVESVAAEDAATVFNAVDRVIQTGHDPRRFVEDLLERFRDLIVINAVPEGASSILRGVPDDQLNRMRAQANQLGAGELSRAADVTNTALTEMTGATSPRLHLELLCARLLLPAADATVRGTLARVDRIERRLEYASGTPAAEPEETPKAPARPRLDVPRTAEEAAARWSLPSADPAAPAAAVPGAHSPAVPAASRGSRPGGAGAPEDSSPDWGGSWGVSTDSAFADSEQKDRPAGQPTTGEPVRTGDASPAAPAAAAPAAAPDPGVQTDGRTGEPAAERTAVDSAAADPAAPPAASGPPPEQPSTQAPLGARHSDGERTPARDDARGQDPTAPRQAAAEHGRRPDEPGAPGNGAPVRGESTGPSWGAPSRPQEAPAAAPQAAPQEPSRSAPEHGRPQQDARRPEQGQSGPQGQPSGSGGSVEMIRRAWPEIMDEVARIKRATWLIVNVSAKPRSFEGNQLVLAFANQGNAIGFQRGPHVDNVKQAIHTVLGLTCSIEAVHDAGGAGESGPKVPASQAAPGSNPGLATPVPAAARTAAEGARPGGAQAPADAGTADGTPRRSGPALSMAGNQPSAGGTPQERSETPAGAPSPGDSQERADTPAAAPPTAGASSPDASVSAAPPRTTTAPAAAGGPGPGTPESVATAPAAPPSAGAAPGGTPVAGGQTPSMPSRSGSHPAARPAPGGARSGDAPGPQDRTAGSTGRQHRPSGSGPRRGDGRGAGPTASSEPPASEAVSAWDPSMSDDSWALVEPPEEAFDPGGDWGPVPEDPYDRRPREPQGAAPARPAASPAAARTEVPAKAAPPSAAAPAAGPQHAPKAAARTAGPEPSRSVVWSPPVAPTSPDSTVPLSPAPPRGVAGTGPRGPVPDAPAGPAAATGSNGTAAPDRPAPAENIRQKPISRYQQLLDEAERKRAEEAAAARGAADRRFVEDEPSADDETLEESGLVGRTAIERILNGRLVEERSIDGQ
ncbi:DNA polymerase III subunit gamma and tau [Arthrobacter sp. B0490]|uniref:DNA polymerase III subunit gamma and tau n=1 Tax=Arthrobacter sp. B0490 TaxID=2058891 RepID=UPI000CE3464A|nr:DNA polymerase III subunit gamma and tau [Arthrobacter sp. B0490]